MKLGITYACYEHRLKFEYALNKAISETIAFIPNIDIKIFREEGEHLNFSEDKTRNEWIISTQEKINLKSGLVARLRNQGIQSALDWGADSILILDDDVILNPDTIIHFILEEQSIPTNIYSCLAKRPHTEQYNIYVQQMVGIAPSPSNLDTVCYAEELYYLPKKAAITLNEIGKTDARQDNTPESINAGSWFYIPTEWKPENNFNMFYEHYGLWKSVSRLRWRFRLLPDKVQLFNPHLRTN